MSETTLLVFAAFAGAAIGLFFFGGLRWTIRKGIASGYAALWFFGSLLLRTSIALVGFYFVGGVAWQRWLSCMLGFFIARVVVMRATRLADVTSKGNHAAHA